MDSCAEIKSTADNFGLFTEIAVCKFLCGLEVVWPETIFILSIVCVYTLLLFLFLFFSLLFVRHIVPYILLEIMLHRLLLLPRPSVVLPVLAEFGGRCRKAMLGVWSGPTMA